MDNTFEKLTEILRNGILAAMDEDNRYLYTDVVDYMMAHGVTLDNQVTSSKLIPVTERLPEKDGRYLVYEGDTGNYYDSYYDETEREFGEWQYCFDPFTLGAIDCDWNSCPNVTHWMPLPEPPKENDYVEIH